MSGNMVKNFLKPNGQKILIFIILAILGVVLPISFSETFESSFPLNIVEYRPSPCPNQQELYEKGIMADCLEKIIMYQNVMINVVIYYFISSLIIFIIENYRGRKR